MNTITLPRRLLAEFLGTGLLVTVVVGSGIAAAQLSHHNVVQIHEIGELVVRRLVQTPAPRALAGIEHSDSSIIDPHKGLFLPFGSGAVLVRERDQLAAANHYRADRYAFAQQWSGKYGPRAGKAKKFRSLCKFGFRLGRNVMDVNGFAIDHRSPYRHPASEG